MDPNGPEGIIQFPTPELPHPVHSSLQVHKIGWLGSGNWHQSSVFLLDLPINPSLSPPPSPRCPHSRFWLPAPPYFCLGETQKPCQKNWEASPKSYTDMWCHICKWKIVLAHYKQIGCGTKKRKVLSGYFKKEKKKHHLTSFFIPVFIFIVALISMTVLESGWNSGSDWRRQGMGLFCLILRATPWGSLGWATATGLHPSDWRCPSPSPA